MNDSKCWALISHIDWANNSHKSSDELKRKLVENFSREECNELTNFVIARHRELYNRINDVEDAHNTTCGCYGGDDSFGDMINHVIGSGEQVFNNVMRDPIILSGINYVESFSYVLPCDEDFEYVKPEYHENAAVECLPFLQRNWEESNNPIALEISNRMTLAAQGKFTEAVDGFDGKMYKKYYTWEGNSRNALYSNVLSDIKNWMT